MNIHELIADRRTVHDYRPDPLPEGALERGLRAALSAPNHRMTEPWRFVRVGPQSRNALLEISADLKRQPDGPPLSGSALEKLKGKMLTPAELIVVSQVKADDPEVAREDYAAVACAVQSAMLAFWSEGIGSKWSTGQVTTDERTYRQLGIDPTAEAIVGFLWVGYALRPETPKPRRRRTLEDVLRRAP
jgi:nitroreductase